MSEHIRLHTQGCYATQDNSGMCHFKPQWHLPEWWKEEKQVLVYPWIWMPDKILDNTVQAIVNCIYVSV